ncbi:hypothetical protein SH611_16885 [Geminicoccaceae bacterium 1502E]|nr:hypothetical protein [Geminicoccaceae bacterium 1502E]
MFVRRAALAAALLATPAAAMADSVTDQLDEGRTLYEEGDFAGAITELEFAIKEIRGKVAGQYVETLPEPPAGWTAEPAQQEGAAAFMGGGTMISRSYRAESGQGSIEAQLMVDNPMIQGFAAMLGNPALMAGQPNMKRVRVGRENAMLNWDESAGSGEITLVMGRAMIKLEGSGLAGPEQLEELLKAWDIKKVKDLAG